MPPVFSFHAFRAALDGLCSLGPGLRLSLFHNLQAFLRVQVSLAALAVFLAAGHNSSSFCLHAGAPQCLVLGHLFFSGRGALLHDLTSSCVFSYIFMAMSLTQL